MQHSHNFVETYNGLVGYGFSREINEATVMIYLQKFSDDTLMQHLLPRLNETQLGEVFDLLSGLLKQHLSESEYHRLFLKDNHQ